MAAIDGDYHGSVWPGASFSFARRDSQTRSVPPGAGDHVATIGWTTTALTRRYGPERRFRFPLSPGPKRAACGSRGAGDHVATIGCNYQGTTLGMPWSVVFVSPSPGPKHAACGPRSWRPRGDHRV